MWVTILVIALAYSGLKWFAWNMACKAVLLYYTETGSELPDAETIKKYRKKVIEKTFRES